MTKYYKSFIIKLIKEQKQELNNNNKNGLTVYPRMIILLFDCVVLIMLMKTYKTKLNPNNKQRTQLLKNAGVARFAYNLAIQIQEENYKNGGKFLSDCDIRKQITLLKQTNLNWLYQYDVDIVKQAVKDACLAYKRFFKRLANKPIFKSKRKNKPSFFIDGWRLKIENGYVKIPKCRKIKLYEKDYIPEGITYANPRITFDGIDWYISVAVNEEQIKSKLTNEIIGIDLGLKELATCSNGMIFHNVAKFDNYKKLEKSIKQKQRQVSRKYQKNKKGNKFVKTNNIMKLEKRILKKRIKQNNIKKDYFHKSTTEIVRTKPSCICLEDLNIAGMRKNKHLSHAIQLASISMFKDMLINKAQNLGIEIVLADRFYPSSQICSSCGNRKVDLKLSERTYKCPVCGLEIDRDFNASINLKHYREFPEKSSLWRAKQTKVA